MVRRITLIVLSCLCFRAYSATQTSLSIKESQIYILYCALQKNEQAIKMVRDLLQQSIQVKSLARRSVALDILRDEYRSERHFNKRMRVQAMHTMQRKIANIIFEIEAIQILADMRRGKK
jgi:hypothetical protein